MNGIDVWIMIALLAVAWFLWQADMAFYAFLAFIGAVLFGFAAMGGQRKAARVVGVTPEGQPIIIKERPIRHGDRTHRYTVKDPWINTKVVEDRFEGIGVAFWWPLKQIVSFLRR